MNWFTKKIIDNASAERKQGYLESRWFGGMCEHVEKDTHVMYSVRAENDPWGSEQYLCCKACDDAITAREGEEEVTCSDCRGTFKKKDTAEWMWYDFYSPQGDKALVLCECCRKADTHKERVARDERNREEEFGRYDDQD